MTAEDVLGAYARGERDFRDASLNGAVLPEADLRGSDFRGALLHRALLTGADLRGADLRGAQLYLASAVRARFAHADIREARLDNAICAGATFRDANLTGAFLVSTNLREADLTDAQLLHASFGGANLSQAKLERANFTGAYFGHTTLADLEKGTLCNYEDLRHNAPSEIDSFAVAKSYRHPRLKQFMVDCGVPALVAEYMIDCVRAIGEVNIRAMLQSTFISYGGPDEPFARKLYDALRTAHVTTFFFPETAKVGERLDREMYRGVNEHDRVLLVCSRSSLTRPGVLNEIQETFSRESRDGGATYLLPITLDDFVFTEWRTSHPQLAQRVLDRVIGDFRGTEHDDARFQAALARVIDALKVKPVLPSSVAAAEKAASGGEEE